MFYALSKVSKTVPILWNRDEVRETTPPGHRLYWALPLGSMWLIPALPIWFIYSVWQLLRERPAVVHGCDAEGMIPAYFYRLLTGTKAVFDIHDVTAGKYDLADGSLLKKLFLWTDCFLIARADAIFIPDPERLDQLGLKSDFRQKIESRCFVIYNSETIEVRPSKKISFACHQELRLVYVGALNKSIRGLEFIIEAAKAEPRLKVDIAGMGADSDYFKKLVEEAGENLTFHGRLSHEQAMELNENADIMITLLNPEFANYQYATSTKVFESMRLGKPLITTADTASGRLVKKTEWGIAIPYTSEALQESLNDILTGKLSFVLDNKKTAPYAWQTMEQQIQDVYRSLISTSR